MLIKLNLAVIFVAQKDTEWGIPSCGYVSYSFCICKFFQVAKGVLTYVSAEVKDLYNLLENEFHPLDLAAKTQPVLSKLPNLSDKLSSASPVPEVHLEQYVPALERLTTLRVLQQVIFFWVRCFCLSSWTKADCMFRIHFFYEGAYLWIDEFDT